MRTINKSELVAMVCYFTIIIPFIREAEIEISESCFAVFKHGLNYLSGVDLSYFIVICQGFHRHFVTGNDVGTLTAQMRSVLKPG